MANNLYKIFQNSRIYKQNLKREIRFWNSQTEFNPNVSLSFQRPIRNYINEIMFNSKVDYELDWQDYLEQNYKIEGDILVLGAGIGTKEEKILNNENVNSVTIIDISDSSTEALRKRFPSKNIYLENNDLNFIQLIKNKYDLIICYGLIHHIINLESLFFELKKSLKTNGLLVINEYVGESKWNWNKERVEFINNKILPLLDYDIINNYQIKNCKGSREK
jgi:2-polyprenyl-3-methyl-5-hydroxy-6-metoxy-1,4-benzoquinol methylase